MHATLAREVTVFRKLANAPSFAPRTIQHSCVGGELLPPSFPHPCPLSPPSGAASDTHTARTMPRTFLKRNQGTSRFDKGGLAELRARANAKRAEATPAEPREDWLPPAPSHAEAEACTPASEPPVRRAARGSAWVVDENLPLQDADPRDDGAPLICAGR